MQKNRKPILTLRFPGEVPASSYGTAFRGRNVYAKHHRAKIYYKEIISKQLPKTFKLRETAIGLKINQYRKIPKSYRTKLKPGDRCLKKPDRTNVDKFVEDVMTGIVYKDDNQVTDRLGPECKIYSDIPRVEVEVYDMS